MRTRARTRRAFHPRLLAVVASLALAACSAPPPPSPLPEQGGRALVLGPDPAFQPASLQDPWWRSPADGPNRFAVVDLSGTTVLRVDAVAEGQPTTAALGRRLAVPLLAMPYLHWAWYLEPAVFGGGPGDGLERGLRISVGFYGGNPDSPQLTDVMFGTGPAGTPLHDRRLDITFGGIGAPREQDATQHMVAVNDKGVPYELRPQEFGQYGEWKLEALDLAKLYEHYWPRDRLQRVNIAFVSVSGLGGRPVVDPAAPPLPLGYVAEVSLTR
jgi:hypothetical protein